MRRCIDLARRAHASGDAPVGALIVFSNEIVGEGVEGVKARLDVSAHAEIEALRAAAGRLARLDLTGCTLYTSVEPCLMCAYAIRLARVSTVVTGAKAVGSVSALSGMMVLTDSKALGHLPTPRVITDVLAV